MIPGMRQTVGRYRITGKLGEGGMGIVYAAHDDQLDRPVAVKMIRELGSGARERERFLREARAAAGVDHPGVCQLFEIGEEEGEPFIAMELLSGEALSTRLETGPLSTDETVQTGLAMLGILQALHQRGFVHRDLKPSNLFLTPHGVKLLDFGLARSVSADVDMTNVMVTSPGALVGTPKYMSPESLRGEQVDARTDLFSAGVLLFEMLTGKTPFKGVSVVEVAHAVLHDSPPVLTGSNVVVAVDRIINRALAKRPADRYESAEAMASDLRQVARIPADGAKATVARQVTRLLVLPFKILRPDPDVDFLSFGLSDAVTASLSGLDSLVVRSSLVASKFSTDTPDLEAIARQAEVDVILAGTLLRAGDRLRVTAQLVETPAGTVVWSDMSQVALGDIFQLQDELARRIVESLELPLTAREHSLLKRDMPASATAYEHYLRAKKLVQPQDLPAARDLYLRCLQEDSTYAPAWAHLGRIYRVMAKYSGEDREAADNLRQARAAFERALEINPDLSVAHNLYVYLQTDMGQAQEAMVRLVDRAGRAGADPELFAGLVHACRYCGLLDASVAAHDHARRLDPKIQTSVPHTYWWQRDYARVMMFDADQIPYAKYLAMLQVGRTDEAIALMRTQEVPENHLKFFLQSARALAQGDRTESIAAIDQILSTSFSDPEGFYYLTRQLAHLGMRDRSIELFGRSVDAGFFCYPAMRDDQWLDSIRTDSTFKEHLSRAESLHLAAVAAFREAGGDTLLGLTRA
jgi:serine/threonine protein kinase/tetratricopeptide (TPR) repeat protein